MTDDLTAAAKLYALDGENATLLRRAGEIVIPELDRVLTRFYERAKSNPEAMRFFDGTAQMDRAKSAQKSHWERLFSARFDAEYAASVKRIGVKHAEIGLPVTVYMSSYALATSDLLEIIGRRAKGGLLARGAKHARALTSVTARAFTLDMAEVMETIAAYEQEEQQRAFSHLDAAIDCLANGDLTHQIPSPEESDFPARFNSVRINLNTAAAKLGQTMSQVGARMNDLIDAARDVGGNTAELARRTENQAAALEQTAAAMQELSSNVTGAAETTEAANAVASEARGDVDAGAGIVSETAEAMTRIRDSSEKISQIIGLIDDVSFQTNLLALNAGVEAARAGEYGRGFSVVASEVRQLAASTSDAAREIKELILSSADEVEGGVQLTEQAGHTFEQIVSSFAKVSELSVGVAQASHEQARTVMEVNSAVRQIDTITQQNAAMAEETTAATQVMLSSADEVQVLLDKLRFQLDAPGSSTSQVAA